MSEITRGVMGMPYEMAMGSEMSRRQFYEIAREVYAENHRLLESLQSLIDQTTPLVPIPGDPMWSQRVTIDELMAENESLRKNSDRYRFLCTQGWFDNALESYGGMEMLDCDNYIDASVDAAIGISSPENP